MSHICWFWFDAVWFDNKRNEFSQNALTTDEMIPNHFTIHSVFLKMFREMIFNIQSAFAKLSNRFSIVLHHQFGALSCVIKTWKFFGFISHMWSKSFKYPLEPFAIVPIGRERVCILSVAIHQIMSTMNFFIVSYAIKSIVYFFPGFLRFMYFITNSAEVGWRVEEVQYICNIVISSF